MREFLLTMILVSMTVLCMILKVHSVKKEQKLLSEIQKWHRIATTDDLTNIKNHRAYSLHIKEMEQKRDKHYGVILFDIDDFKKINDTYGHLMGDNVLKTFAVMLNDVFSEEKYSIYRIGGDEFAVLAENVTEGDIIDRLLEVRRFEMEQGRMRCSKGYEMIDTKRNFNKAFVRADEMLYADKMSKKKICK